MYTTIIILHVLCCIFLVTVVLLQVGRGRGMVGFLGASSADTLFGSRTGDVLTRSTTIIAALFMVTSLTLAYLSLKKTGSVVKNIKPRPGMTQTTMPVGEGVQQGEDKVVQKGSELVEKAKGKILDKIPVLGKKDEGNKGVIQSSVPTETTKSNIKYDEKGNKIVDELKYNASGELVGHKEIVYDKTDKIISEKDLPLKTDVKNESIEVPQAVEKK